MAPTGSNKWLAQNDGTHGSSQRALGTTMAGSSPLMGHQSSENDISTAFIPTTPSSPAMTSAGAPDHQAALKRKGEEDFAMLVAQKRRQMPNSTPDGQSRDIEFQYPTTPSPSPHYRQNNIFSAGTNTSQGLEFSSASPANHAWPQDSPQSPQNSRPQATPQQLHQQFRNPTLLPPRKTVPTPVDLEIMSQLQSTVVHGQTGIKIPSTKKTSEFKESVQALEKMRRPYFLPGPPVLSGPTQGFQPDGGAEAQIM